VFYICEARFDVTSCKILRIFFETNQGLKSNRTLELPLSVLIVMDNGSWPSSTQNWVINLSKPTKAIEKKCCFAISFRSTMDLHCRHKSTLGQGKHLHTDLWYIWIRCYRIPNLARKQHPWTKVGLHKPRKKPRKFSGPAAVICFNWWLPVSR